VGSYRVYCGNSMETNACGYYRMQLPLLTMDQMGLPVDVIYSEGAKLGLSNQQMAALFLESDITMLYQNIGDYAIKLMEAAEKFKPLPSTDLGTTRHPPTFVADTDDDLFNVHPLNMTFSKLGIKDWKGNLLEDGSEIGFGHPFETLDEAASKRLTHDPEPGAILVAEGKKWVYDPDDNKWHSYILLWKDGENTDFSLNRKKLDHWKKTCNMVKLITCSTPRSAEYIKREVPGARTFVVPNCIDFRRYPEVALRDHPDEIRILWEGSATHHEGLWPISESIGRLAKKYPTTTWYFFGAPYRWAAQHLPAERVKFVDWVAWEAYSYRLSMIGHDISFAPLAMHTFNDSRSAIRWYENSAIWKPAATVCQRWGPYQDEIEEGKTGLMFDTPEEFEAKMSAVIEDEKLRKDMAANSKDWVRTNRDPKKHALSLFNKWVEVREEHKASIPVEESLDAISTV
jgi:glycosyltransferase involved in cell wall biosynthesis